MLPGFPASFPRLWQGEVGAARAEGAEPCVPLPPRGCCFYTPTIPRSRRRTFRCVLLPGRPGWTLLPSPRANPAFQGGSGEKMQNAAAFHGEGERSLDPQRASTERGGPCVSPLKATSLRESCLYNNSLPPTPPFRAEPRCPRWAVPVPVFHRSWNTGFQCPLLCQMGTGTSVT